MGPNFGGSDDYTPVSDYTMLRRDRGVPHRNQVAATRHAATLLAA